MNTTLNSAFYASRLRLELIMRCREFARGRPHVESYGSMPVIVFSPSENSEHGNFSNESYAAILRNPAWLRRLDKKHAQAKRSLPAAERAWRELDSSTSSDALLMNIFCHPGVCESSSMANLLGTESGTSPEFGFRARVPLGKGVDRTEVDMRIGSLLIEAKLTESDFQTAPVEILERYRDFAAVFDRKSLPKVIAKNKKCYQSYQLIRNVLAAHALNCDFCVMHDERRPDLREQWFTVMSSVKNSVLQRRCKVLTWQELVPVFPSALRSFLDVKYGIAAPGEEAMQCEVERNEIAANGA